MSDIKVLFYYHFNITHVTLKFIFTVCVYFNNLITSAFV